MDYLYDLITNQRAEQYSLSRILFRPPIAGTLEIHPKRDLANLVSTKSHNSVYLEVEEIDIVLP